MNASARMKQPRVSSHEAAEMYDTLVFTILYIRDAISCAALLMLVLMLLPMLMPKRTPTDRPSPSRS
jgi:hypothetical protein